MSTPSSSIPVQAAMLQSVVNDALDHIVLEASLAEKLLRFRDFINELMGSSGGLKATTFAHLADATDKQIFVFMVLMYSVVTKNGSDKVTAELVSMMITKTCMEQAGKEPLELMTAEQMSKLERYIIYFATVIEAKNKASVN